MSSMYRAAQKLYTSATAPSKKQKAKQEGWRVENLAAAPSTPPEDDVVVLQAAHEAYVAVDVAAPSRGGGDTNGAFARQAVEFDVETDLAPADTPARPLARSPRAVAEAAKAAAARNKAAAAAAAPADADIDRDDDDADAEPEPVPPRVWDKYRRYRESASRVIAQLRIE